MTDAAISSLDPILYAKVDQDDIKFVIQIQYDVFVVVLFVF